MVTPDVSANDLTDMAGDGRFVAIIMDDWNIPFDDHEMILNSRAVGRYLVDALNPSDVAAVIFPQQAGKTQDFTTDRQKLIAAIDKFEPPEVKYMEARPQGLGPGGGDMPQRFAPILMRSDCQRSQPTVPTLDTVVAKTGGGPEPPQDDHSRQRRLAVDVCGHAWMSRRARQHHERRLPPRAAGQRQHLLDRSRRR